MQLVIAMCARKHQHVLLSNPISNKLGTNRAPAKKNGFVVTQNYEPTTKDHNSANP